MAYLASTHSIGGFAVVVSGASKSATVVLNIGEFLMLYGPRF